MPDEPIASFIQRQLDRGVSAQDMQQSLVAAGWPRDIIKTYTGSSQGKTLMEAKGLTKSFGKKLVLSNASLDIRKGEILGLIGASGAGKTTLISMLVGALEPDAGDVTLTTNDAAVSIIKHPNVARSRIGYSTQKPSLYPAMTSMENLEHFATLYGLGKNAKRAAKSQLEHFKLSEYAQVPAGNLSGGLQKQLDIACSLIHNPDVLFLDEPLADLDPILTTVIINLVKSINRQGTTVVIASHFIDALENVCNRIAIVRNHTIAEVGTVEELQRIFAKNTLVRVTMLGIDDLAKAAPSAGLSIASLRRSQQGLVIASPFPDDVVAFVQRFAHDNKRTITQLAVSKPTIRELFESIA